MEADDDVFKVHEVVQMDPEGVSIYGRIGVCDTPDKALVLSSQDECRNTRPRWAIRAKSGLVYILDGGDPSSSPEPVTLNEGLEKRFAAGR